MNSNMKVYYVKVASLNAAAFEKHLIMSGAEWSHLSTHGAALSASSLYHVKMDSESALSLKLSFPLLGCLDFNKTMGKIVKQALPTA
jgi:hypothetical protein